MTTKTTDQIRVETYTITQYWPDTLTFGTRPSGKYQCRMFRGPAADNLMVACGPYRPSEREAWADALTLRQGEFS